MDLRNDLIPSVSVITMPRSPASAPRFHIGVTYSTNDGRAVKIVAEKRDLPGYECVKGDDGAWRYDREGDRGRTTGTAHDGSDPRNLILPV